MQRHVRSRLDRAIRIATWEDERILTQRIRGKLIRHVAPIVQIGSGRSSLAFKFQAVMHALFLLPTTHEIFADIIKSIPTWISDLGTEIGVARIKPISMQQVFPYMLDEVNDDAESMEVRPPSTVGEINFAADVLEQQPRQQNEVDFAEEVDFAAAPQRAKLSEIMVDVTGSLEVSGLLHIIQNAGKGLGAVLEHYDEAVHRLSKLAALLKQKETKDRLFETCFGTTVGRALWSSIAGFDGECYVERWGTVANCVLQVTDELEAAIRWGWDMDKYFGGSGSYVPLDKDQYLGKDNPHDSRIDLVDDTINSTFWWAYWRMLRAKSRLLSDLIVWAESCACHYDLLHAGKSEPDATDDLPKEIRKVAETCPLRGLRCAEMATGDFLELVFRLYDLRTVMMLKQIPSDVSEAKRLTIVSEYEKGRAYLVTTFTLKTTHFQHPPFCAFGMAHYCEKKALASYNKTKQSDHPHPMVMQLKDDELQQECAQFEELGGSFMDPDLDHTAMSGLRSWIAKRRLAFSAERPVEAEHAKTKRDVDRAPNHSDPFVSISHRLTPLLDHIKASKNNFEAFANLVDTIKNGRFACAKLGLQDHPRSIQHYRRGRHPEHFNVVYHADTWTKYVMPAPPIETENHDFKPLDGLIGSGADETAPDVKRDAAVRHLHQATQHHADSFFSMFLESGTFRTLESVMETSSPDQATAALEWVGEEIGISGKPLAGSISAVAAAGTLHNLGSLGEKAKSLIFFRLVDSNVGMAKRTKIAGQRKLAGLKAVTLHRLLELNVIDKTCVVGLTPTNVEASSTCGAIPMTMHPGMFSTSSLMKMRFWEQDATATVVQVANHYELHPDLLPHAPQVLSSLMLDRGDGIAADTWGDDCHCKRVIQQLATDEMVEGPPWKLTLRGREHLECGVRLSTPKPLLTFPAEDADLNEVSLAELILLMEHKDWQLVTYVSKERATELKKTPFLVDAVLPVKQWYSKKNNTVSRFYLMALLAAQNGRPVPHFGKDEVCRALLDIKPPERIRRKTKALQYIDECEWPEDALPLPAMPKRRCNREKRARLRAHLQEPADDDIDEFGIGAAIADDDTDNDSLSTDSSDSSTSSSSTSSNSDSKKTSDADGAEDDDECDDLPPLPPPALPPAEICSQPELQAESNGNLRYGFCSLTLYVQSSGKTGWQMTCNHAAHVGKPKCTKSQTSHADGNEDGTLRRLKYWAFLGLQATSKMMHADMWKHVVLCWDQGLVPSMTELDDGRMPLFASMPLSASASSSSGAQSGAQSGAADKKRKR